MWSYGACNPFRASVSPSVKWKYNSQLLLQKDIVRIKLVNIGEHTLGKNMIVTLLLDLVKVTCMLRCFSRVRLFVTPWAVDRQGPLSMGFPQARILEWVAISFSRGPSCPRDGSPVPCIAGRLVTIWATREGYRDLSIAEVQQTLNKLYILAVDSTDSQRRQWHPTPVLLPGKSMDGGAW